MFELNEKESENLKKWDEEHYKVCPYGDPKKQGCIGGVLTFMFTPTTMGLVVKVKCACGEVKDCSDYGSW